MAYLELEQYEKIMKFMKPVFLLFVILFFTKEFSLLFSWSLIVDLIPDWLFLVTFSIYALFYMGPIFNPDWVEGYELPEYEEEIEEEEELSEEEKEIKELERISL